MKLMPQVRGKPGLVQDLSRRVSLSAVGRRAAPRAWASRKRPLPAERQLRTALAAASERLEAALATLQAKRAREQAAEATGRKLQAGAAVLALSVLTDSALEHYRGSFQNRAMFAPLIASTISLAAGAAGAMRLHVPRFMLEMAHGVAAATGLAGFCFHVYNILKRPNGFSWLNLFYAAPIGAPFALTLAGLFGRWGMRLSDPADRPAKLLGQPAGRTVAAAAAGGVLGTVAEAGLLHFRGAYHNPAMFLPVSVPPLTAALLGAAAASPNKAADTAARGALWATALLGAAGVGFHIYGVARNMGGWRNWSQNVLNGPPVPAPPSFAGLAVIGLAALALMDAER